MMRTTTRMPRTWLLVWAGLAGIIGLNPCAIAGTFTWDTGPAGSPTVGDGTWDAGVSANWTTDGGTTKATFTSSLDSDAVFAGADGTYAIDVAGPLNIHGLTFSNSGYTLSAAAPQTINLYRNSSNSNPVVSVAQTATIGNNVNVTSSRSFVINGGGTIYVTTGGKLIESSSQAMNISNTNVVVDGGSFGATNSSGQLNISGGSLTLNSGTVTAAGTIFNYTLQITSGAKVNLNGGTMTAGHVAPLTGSFNFNGGTLKVANSVNLSNFISGGGGTYVQIGGAIIDTNGFDPTITAVLSHDSSLGATPDGGLTKNGAGQLTLSSSNNYTGGTTINQGTLVLANNNAAGSGGIHINGGQLVVASGKTITNAVSFGSSGGTISGTGAINAAVTLNNINQVLSPGNSPGILPFGVGQVWNSYTYQLELNDWTGASAGVNFDQIAITGGLDLSGASAGSIVLDIRSLTAGNAAGDVANFAQTAGSWTIVTTTGGITGFDPNDWTILTSHFSSSPVAAGNWQLNVAGNDLVLSYVVPEPTTLGLLAIGGLLVFSRRCA